MKECWNSKFGLILASAGSAVGLGNLWRFPYLTAKDGGGAFLLLYLIFAVLLGQVLLITETALGVKSQQGPFGAFASIHPKFKFLGLLPVLTVSIILPYYSVIGGWILIYLSQSLFLDKNTDFTVYFNNLISSNGLPLIALAFFIFISLLIVNRGVRKGIERFCTYSMPLLIIFLIILIGRVLTLPNAIDGVKFFFIPDFSKINLKTCIDALGQVFFSISIGSGLYITYGSYLNQKENKNIGKTMWPVVSFDTFVSLLTGFAIFPAVFSLGIEMNAGPTLIFVTFPKIFSTIYGGNFFAFVFFFIFILSALTSSISMAEVLLSYLTDKFSIKRKTVLPFMFIYYLIIGILASLSFGQLNDFKIAGKTLFELMDFMCSNVLMPFGGFATCIAVGWFTDVTKFRVFKKQAMQKGYEICVRWITPIIMLTLIIDCLK